MDLQEFWKKLEATSLDKLSYSLPFSGRKRLSGAELRSYCDYFAKAHREIFHHPAAERAAIERMESLQRELDRRSKFWATVVGTVVALPAAVVATLGIAQCGSNRQISMPEPSPVGTQPSTFPVPQ